MAEVTPGDSFSTRKEVTASGGRDSCSAADTKLFISSPEASGLSLVVTHNHGSVWQVVTATDSGHSQQLAYQERQTEGDDPSGLTVINLKRFLFS